MQVFSCEIGEIFRNTFSTEQLWWLLLKSKSFKFSALFVMISFLFKTCGFTNNPNFIGFKWRLKRKHSLAKCVIRATEIRRIEIRNAWNNRWKRNMELAEKADLKVETEAMLCAAQEQAIRTNYVKHKVDKTAQSPLCRICDKKSESNLILWANVKSWHKRSIREGTIMLQE